ncbi:MAG: hypothetical protein ACTSQ8_07790 [Candidatus Helarchaeota archaeon]
MSVDEKYCSRCGKMLGETILRKDGEEPVYNLHITEFKAGEFGHQIGNFNLCVFCKKDFDEFMEEKKNVEKHN